MFAELLSELGSPEYPNLRPSQQEVLDSYSEILGPDGSQFIQSDIAIEMPAGTGKTLVALLIAEKHRRLGRSVAILAGTKQLANQIKDDASDLGLNVIVFEGPGHLWNQRDIRKYNTAQTTAIMNYWAYFNINPTPPSANVLIMDDAHLAENTIRDLFTLKISRGRWSDLYRRILMTFVSLRPGRYSSLDDIIHDRVQRIDTIAIPFSDWIEVQSAVRDLLDSANRTAEAENILDSILFTWPRIRQNADALTIYISSFEIELRPVILPSLDNNHFAQPLHRIYLSATLGDPEDFRRRIGCSNLHLIRTSTYRPGERGRRMIVLFPSAEEGPDSDQIRHEGLHHLWSVARKRLWMCASWDEVEIYKDWTPPVKNGTPRIWEIKGSDETQLEEFRQARLGHLFTAARYDGIDFPGDQARLAIIPSPPVTVDAQEEFFSSFLKDASFMKSRFSQRVAQALGRCNRSSSDFAVYVFLSGRFERVFGGNDPEYLALLPADIIPEVEAALENTDNGFITSCEKAAQFLSGNFEEWDNSVTEYRENPRRRQILNVPETTQNEVLGWLALWRGNPSAAVDYFSQCASALSNERQSGTLAFANYCLAFAQYLCYKRLNEQEKLQDAINSLRTATQEGPSYWFTLTLRGALNDLLRESAQRVSAAESRIPTYTEAVLQTWDNILFDRGLRTSALVRWLDRCQQNLISNQHDEVVEAILTLGHLAGFDCQRPHGQGMPDVFWRYNRGPLHFITFEVKAELEDERSIALRDVNQTHGQGRWAQSDFGTSGYTCVPLLVGRFCGFEEGVSDRLGTVRCLTQSSLVKLAEAIRSNFDIFRSNWRITDSDSRIQARQIVQTRIPQAEWLIDAYNGSADFISEESLVSPWISSA